MIWRRLGWRSRSARRALVREVCKRWYRDDDRDIGRAVLITGTARSGTTWLAEIISSQIASRLMFEPFNPELVEEYGTHHYFQYMRPDDEDEQLHSYCQQVFSGAVRHPWIDRRVEHLLPRRRLIKDVRTTLFLRWIRNRFPEIPVIFVLRHPCAVVASRLRLGWADDADIERLLCQPKLRQDFLQDKDDLIEGARTAEEKHALVWCITNLVPLKQLDGKEPGVFYYEDLCTHPEVEIRRLFGLLGHAAGPRVLTALDRPSTTAREFSAIVTGDDRVTAWRRWLSPEQTDRVLAVVEAFGLGRLYGDSDTPLARDPWRVAGDE